MFARYFFLILGVISLGWIGYVSLDLVDKNETLSAEQLFGKEAAANVLYRKMIRLDSTYHEAYFQLGYIKQFTDVDLDSALYFYNAALDIEPRHIESNHNIGLIYEDKKDISKALLSYAKVLKYNPEFKLTLERVAVLKKRR